jgi:pullulanase/glycogen debranching enzyme
MSSSDVVYNYTTEAGSDGPTYSYRGICNSSYYLLDESMTHYRNDTGRGNVLRSAHPIVRRIIVDSLHFSVREMHIDGFRFDLASIFSRNDDGSLNLEDPPIISEITGSRISLRFATSPRRGSRLVTSLAQLPRQVLESMEWKVSRRCSCIRER